MKTHPIADLLPLLAGDEFEELVADIAAHGLREPIGVTPDGLILDGRNRYRACLAADVEPRTVTVSCDPLAYVISENIRRRHLNEPQRASFAARLATMPFGGNQHTKAEGPPIGGPSEPISQAAAAAQLNVSVRGVQRAAAVQREATPEVIAAVDAGSMAVEAAAKLAKQDPAFQRAVAAKVRAGVKTTEATRQVKRETLSERVAVLPPDTYRILYADPPWQYNDSRATGDHREATAAATHYPTMSEAEIAALDVASLAQPDAVLFLWATFPLLPDALRVQKAWGFRYKTAFVWAKGRGSFGHYHKADAELLLLGTRGSCVPDVSTREAQVQSIPREGRHSQKPEAFRHLIDGLYPIGPRIELFARGPLPPPWVGWGNEHA